MTAYFGSGEPGRVSFLISVVDCILNATAPPNAITEHHICSIADVETAFHLRDTSPLCGAPSIGVHVALQISQSMRRLRCTLDLE